MPKSPELKKIVAESLDTERIQNTLDSSMRYAQYDRQEKLREQMKAETDTIDTLEAVLEGFRENADEMDDAQFEEAYAGLEKEIAELASRVTRYSDEAKESRRYVTDFEKMDAIKSFDGFMEKWPMYWMPRKEEIGRILTVAKKMHDARLECGEKAGKAVRILDIGGGNGALGKLCADLARQNGLEIEYVVVDPDEAAVKKAEEGYKSDGSLKFRMEDAGAFSETLHAGDAETTELIKRRANLASETRLRRRDAGILFQRIDKDERAGELDDEAKKTYAQILKHDIGIEIDPEEISGSGGDGIDQELFRRGQAESAELTRRIEGRLARKSADFDLVINSWMPPNVDFTKDIRTANGAAVMYILETHGATGRQRRASWSSEPREVGEEDSYGVGEMYDIRFGWVGHSLPQISRKKGDLRAYGGYDERDTPPYSNAFIVQTKKMYVGKTTRFDPDPKSAGLKFGEPYPWEKTLTERGGNISPTVGLREREKTGDDYYRDYHVDLEQLAKRLRIEDED